MLVRRITRRGFFPALAGAVGWPVAGQAQQKPTNRVARIAFVSPFSENDQEMRKQRATFFNTLQQLGWTEGSNYHIDYRGSAFGAGRAAAIAAEVVSLAPNVILALGTPIAEAMRLATRTIPVVSVAVTDPVGSRLVTNLAHPDGNLTGFTNYDFPMASKWLETLKEVAPNVTRVLVNMVPGNSAHPGFLRAIEAAGSILGVKTVATAVVTAAQIEQTINEFAAQPNGGLVVIPGTPNSENRDLIVGLAARHRLPAIYSSRPFIASGGLMSYETDPNDYYRRAATYIDRILKGTSIGDLPVQNPTKFEFVVNLKTAKALGLTIPLPLLGRADEVIE